MPKAFEVSSSVVGGRAAKKPDGSLRTPVTPLPGTPNIYFFTVEPRLL